MANSTATILEKMKSLEKEFQLLRIEMFLSLRKMANKISVVKKTGGILGKSFPKGVEFENLIRKGWDSRFEDLKI